LREFESFILIEHVVYLERYYDCAVFSDSLTYFFQAQYLKRPQMINLNAYPLHTPKLSLYIFEKVRRGELADILEQSEKTTIMTPPMSVFLTIIKKEGKKINIEGYDLNVFVPKEKLIEMDPSGRRVAKRPPTYYFVSGRLLRIFPAVIK